MKKILIVLLVLMAFGLFADGLNDDAAYLKDGYPDIYGAIRGFAVDKWETDHAMIVWEINKQSTAFFNVMSMNFDLYSDIFVEALVKWADDDGLFADLNNYANYKVDWVMVFWEMEKQISAVSVY